MRSRSAGNWGGLRRGATRNRSNLGCRPASNGGCLRSRTSSDGSSLRSGTNRGGDRSGLRRSNRGGGRSGLWRSNRSGDGRSDRGSLGS